MTRVAVYARYSSELQRERSIDDQFALCRDFAVRRNWTVTTTYADRAISGASIHGRHEFQRMVEDAKDGSSSPKTLTDLLAIKLTVPVSSNA